jgi:hypothetical protein
MGHAGHICSVCSHPSAADIQRALDSGARLAEIASQYGLGRSSLYRHIDAGHARNGAETMTDNQNTQADMHENDDIVFSSSDELVAPDTGDEDRETDWEALPEFTLTLPGESEPEPEPVPDVTPKNTERTPSAEPDTADLELPQDNSREKALLAEIAELKAALAAGQLQQATQQATAAQVAPIRPAHQEDHRTLVTTMTAKKAVNELQWHDYALDDPRLFKQMYAILQALDWPRLLLGGSPLYDCGEGEQELSAYLRHLEQNSNNELARIRGAQTVKQLLVEGQQRQADVERATAAALWHAQQR